MDETTFRILDALSSGIGRPMTIQTLTQIIRKRHETAHYKNIHDKAKSLEKEKVLKIHKIGRDSLVELNFDNSILTSVLSRMEHRKKESLLRRGGELETLITDMMERFDGLCHLSSVSAVNPRKNLALRRMELLFIMNEPALIWEIEGKPETEEDREKHIQGDILHIHYIMKKLRDSYPLRIDYLILREGEILELLREADYNPLRHMLSEQVALLHPEDYWTGLKNILREGGKLGNNEEISPFNVSDAELTYNMDRFLYPEFGSHAPEGKRFCLEQTIAAALLKGRPRQANAIPALLGIKRERKRKPLYNLLIFVCVKYGKGGNLLGILKALNKMEKDRESGRAILIMEKMGIKPKRVNEGALKEVVRTYYGR